MLAELEEVSLRVSDTEVFYVGLYWFRHVYPFHCTYALWRHDPGELICMDCTVFCVFTTTIRFYLYKFLINSVQRDLLKVHQARIKALLSIRMPPYVLGGNDENWPPERMRNHLTNYSIQGLHKLA